MSRQRIVFSQPFETPCSNYCLADNDAVPKGKYPKCQERVSTAGFTRESELGVLFKKKNLIMVIHAMEKALLNSHSLTQPSQLYSKIVVELFAKS